MVTCKSDLWAPVSLFSRTFRCLMFMIDNPMKFAENCDIWAISSPRMDQSCSIIWLSACHACMTFWRRKIPPCVTRCVKNRLRCLRTPCNPVYGYNLLSTGSLNGCGWRLRQLRWWCLLWTAIDRIVWRRSVGFCGKWQAAGHCSSEAVSYMWNIGDRLRC